MTEYRVSKAAAADLLEIGLYTQNKWGMTKQKSAVDYIEQRFR